MVDLKKWIIRYSKKILKSNNPRDTHHFDVIVLTEELANIKAHDNIFLCIS